MPTTTRFYLSKNGKVDSSDVQLGARGVDALEGGRSSTGTTSVQVPQGTAPGSYSILAIADADGATVELDESNNLRKWSLTVQ